MWDYCGHSLETARLRGATYADVRVMHMRQRDLTTKNGQVGTLGQSESIGLGIRVVANGAWGFASTDQLTRQGVASCAAQAVAIAKASALAKKKRCGWRQKEATSIAGRGRARRIPSRFHWKRNWIFCSQRMLLCAR